MRKISVMFALLLVVVVATAQSRAEYNRKGDEAMKSLDYHSAKMWYEDGVVNYCDPHSISQLTTIWSADSTMHNVLRGVMNKCLTCLDNRASLDDTTSIIMLIRYYSEGIGVYKNETKAELWKSRLEKIKNPYQAEYGQRGSKTPREKEKMDFFAGYAATLEAPFGLTFGGVGRTVGWYLRFRTNMSFQNYDNEFGMEGSEPFIVGGLSDALPHFTGKNEYKVDTKVNAYVGTVGLVFKIVPSFYLSVGGGYCKREFLAKYNKVGKTVADYDPSGPFWAVSNDKKSTYSGAAIDLDGTFKIGESFYGSIGCTTFNFKNLSVNAGIGVFF